MVLVMVVSAVVVVADDGGVAEPCCAQSLIDQIGLLGLLLQLL
jgi:hypothetical protein